MVSRFALLVLLLFAVGILLLVIRWIVKLPQKYERKPRALNPWAALDNGIDPSEIEGSTR